MSFLDSIFSDSSTKEQQSGSTQSSTSNNTGQSNSQNNLWPYLQPYAGTFLNTAFSPAAFNQYQTGAANSQANANNMLTPGFSALSGIAQNGLSPTAYQPYMSQYTQSVVDPTVAEFERLNKGAVDSINGSLAKSGALGNSNNSMTRANALAPVLNNQKAQIASLYNTGYNNAQNLAAQSNQQQMGAAQGLGSLVGQYTGANTALAGMGNFQQFAPLQWMTQGASGLSPFLQGAGVNSTSNSTTNSSGSSTGWGTGTQTNNPSIWDAGTALAGTAASFLPKLAMFSDERVKDNIAEIGKTFDGQPIYKFNYKGSPQTQIGLMAQDVEKVDPDAVGSVHGIKTVDYDKATAPAAMKGHFAAGGGVSAMTPYEGKPNLHQKFADAFQAIHSMKERARGGSIKGYDGGGTVGPWSTTINAYNPSSTMGDDIVGKAQMNQFASDLGSVAKAGQMPKHDGNRSPLDTGMDSAQSSLASFMANNVARPMQPLQTYDNGGSVPSMSDEMTKDGDAFSKLGDGGTIQGFADAGVVRPYDDNDPGTSKPIEAYAIPKFQPSDDLTYAGAKNDPGITPLAPMTAFKPRVADAGSFGESYSVPQFKNLAPSFSTGVQSLYEQAQKDGISLRPLSGYRDEAAQRRAIEQVAQRNGIPITPELYARGIPGMAAPVGKSQHQHGAAMDWDVSDPLTKKWLYDNAPKYGLRFPLPGSDSGHMELDRGGTESGTQVASGAPSMEGRMSLGGPKPQAEPTFFDKLFSGPMFTGDYKNPQGNAALTLWSASKFAKGMADNAAKRRDQDLAEANAQRLMEQWQATTSGRMPNGELTAAEQHYRTNLAEQQRQSDKPVYGLINEDQYGNRKYGLIDVTKAMPPRSSDATTGTGTSPIAAATGAAGMPAGVVTEGPITHNRGNVELTGEDFLKTLDPADAVRVKRIAEYDEPFPSGLSANRGRGAFLAQAVSQYNPEYDAKQYQSRQKVLNTFKSGPVQEQIKSLNTIAGHLDDLDKYGKRLNNSSWLPSVVNPIINTYRTEVNPNDKERQQAQEDFANFKTARLGVAGELAKVFRASGMSVGEIEDWKHRFEAASSPAELKATARSAVHLIEARLDALKNTWHEGMGPNKPFTAVTPRAQDVFERLRGGEDRDHGTGSPSGSKTSEPARPAVLPDEVASKLKAIWEANKATPEGRRRFIEGMQQQGMTEQQVRQITGN